MKVKELAAFLDGLAPFSTQAPWDNSGVLAGDPDAEVTGVLAALDVTGRETALARETGANLIVSHHPVIFRPAKSVTRGDPVYECVRLGISVISAHTCYDKAPGGVNDVLCDALGMTYEKCPPEVADGFLNVGEIPGISSAEQLAAHLKEKLGGAVRYSDGGSPVGRIAVCSGAGGEFFPEAAALGCAALVTGDADYHDFLDSARMGVSLFAAGHFETEAPAVAALAGRLREAFPGLTVTVSDRKTPVITIA